MDAVRRDDDIGFGAASVGERHPGLVAVLREAAAPVPGVDGAGRQGIASIATRSARCIPNVAFQPEESVT